MVLIIYLFLITKAWLHHLPLIRNFLNPASLPPHMMGGGGWIAKHEGDLSLMLLSPP